MDLSSQMRGLIWFQVYLSMLSVSLVPNFHNFPKSRSVTGTHICIFSSFYTYTLQFSVININTSVQFDGEGGTPIMPKFC